MRRVHLVRAALTAALLSVAALAAAPAAAGGPTSALLSIPGAGSTASLYYTDPEYDDLANLVGVSEPSGTFDTVLSGGHESGPGITITWLIHDVQPWRVDRVYLGGEDGPWISTQIMDDTGSLWESPVRWHQPENAARLTSLLDGLGLGTAASKNTDFDGVAGASEQKTTAAAPPAAKPAAATADTESGWLGSASWALGGLVGGALLMLAWTRRHVVERADKPRPLDGSVEVLAR